MSEQKIPFSRRRFLATTALGAAAAASGSLAMPSVLRAQGGGVKLGLLHPVTGALSYSGQQGRLGATMAIDEINAAGGIKALGAKIDPVLGDAQSTPDGGTAEVEKMNSAGVACIVGGYASIDLPRHHPGGGALRSALRRRCRRRRHHRHPRAEEHVPLRPGLRRDRQDRARQSRRDQRSGRQAGQDRDDRARGFAVRLRPRQAAQRPAAGARAFEVLETIAHPTPTRDFNNVVLKIKAQNPDLVIPANYYNEYVLLARTMQQQHVRPKGIYSVLGGAASSYKFVKEFPDAAKYIMDCNHWFDPRSAKAQALKKKVEDKGQFFTYEVYLNYSCVQLVADALERAASADRAKIIAALESSTFSGHIMPYGPTKFVNGQNQGAAPANTQVLDNDIKVILPREFANAKPVFPMPA